MTNSLAFLRIVGILEGISFLVLLLIAMPLKYLLHIDMAVKIAGWAHGVLFILYLAAVVWAALAHRWGIKRIALAIVAAFLPAGPFFLEGSWRKEQEAEAS